MFNILLNNRLIITDLYRLGKKVNKNSGVRTNCGGSGRDVSRKTGARRKIQPSKRFREGFTSGTLSCVPTFPVRLPVSSYSLRRFVFSPVCRPARGARVFVPPLCLRPLNPVFSAPEKVLAVSSFAICRAASDPR